MLACSASELTPRDTKTLLVMSDASGPGLRTTSDGYLTGYPLVESGFYALARTWSAPEMPRPGCVWTHTVLIEFGDLANVAQLAGLISAFERPEVPNSIEKYGAHMLVELGPESSADLEEIRSLLMSLIHDLYTNPRNRIFVPSESGEIVESGVLHLWSQQWPKLRRSFRFCTQSYSDRSQASEEPFDLQFGPASVMARARELSELTPPTTNIGNHIWDSLALEDLLHGVPGLRAFLRTTGAEIADGRRAFPALVEVFAAIQSVHNSGTLDSEILRLVDKSFPPNEGRSLRSAVVAIVLQNVDSCENSDFEYLLDNLDLVDADLLAEKGDLIGGRLWRQSPMRFVRLLEASGLPSMWLPRVLGSFSVPDLLQGLSAEPLVTPAVLKRRPEIAVDPEYWKLKSEITDWGLRSLSSDSPQFADAIEAMITAGRPELSETVVHRFGSGPVLRSVLEYMSKARSGTTSAAAMHLWLRAGLHEPSVIAGELARETGKSRIALAAIARATSPDTVPNDYGHDPWLLAMRLARDSLDASSAHYLSAYLLSRALGYRSRSQAELAAFCFDDVYVPALTSQLSNDAWMLLDFRLPRSAWGFEWDRCRRLRTGLLEAFVGRDLSVEFFAALTKSDDLFVELANETAHMWRGRAYLRRTLVQVRLSPMRIFAINAALG
jgi:hypothetical protein